MNNEVCTLIMEIQPFKEVENYFMNVILYEGALVAIENLSEIDYNSGNNADSKLGLA